MERLPDLIHWKRRRPAEDWRVSGQTQIYLRFWEVLSLYRNLSVPLFMCNHTRFLYRFEQQVCWGKKKKNLVEEPSCTTLLCHEHIVNVFITQKQSNFELFIFSLNTLAYIIFKGALCSLKLKYLNSFHN